MYLKSLFYFQETAIKWQIVLSTWRNRILKDIWFRNKAWWLSELPLPEPLRSLSVRVTSFAHIFLTITGLDSFMLAMQSAWRGRLHVLLVPSLPVSDGFIFQLIIGLTKSLWGSSAIEPWHSPSAKPWVGSMGCPVSTGNQFSMQKIRVTPHPAWCTANSWLKEWFAFSWSAFKMQKLLWVLLLTVPSPNVLCKPQAPLYSSCSGRLDQITITSCSDSV